MPAWVNIHSPPNIGLIHFVNERIITDYSAGGLTLLMDFFILKNKRQLKLTFIKTFSNCFIKSKCFKSINRYLSISKPAHLKSLILNDKMPEIGSNHRRDPPTRHKYFVQRFWITLVVKAAALFRRLIKIKQRKK